MAPVRKPVAPATSPVAGEVLIYCDGACSGNPGPGGYGAVLLCAGKEREISGFDPKTTNNRMELMAAIAALAALTRSCSVSIYTDSQYVCRGIQEWLPAWIARGWRTAAGKPVLNQDLWEQLAQQVARHQIHWHWVRGHSGVALNERADQLARSGLEAGRNGRQPAMTD